MISFREFMNMQDRMPSSLSLKPAFSGVHIMGKDFKPPSVKAPKSSLSIGVAMPSLGLNPGRSSVDKPIPTKPHRFLPRKGSTLRKGF